ncbi:MAG: aminopeptidase P family protein [Deltaproteobacteria bacterium]|nr:MAG: aminopeptidase P family protein [Deltaproteobacteria bacterium]
MRKRDDMTFSSGEYERRLQALRERMEQRRLDAVIISDPKNLFYLTDYQTTGYSFFQAIVVPLEGEPFMITRKLEESNVFARTWVEITRPYWDTGDAIQMLVSGLSEFGLMNKCIGYERNSYFFPAYQQDRFHANFRDGRVQDCFGIVEEGRICKSDEEIALMRRAARATEAGMRAGFEACVPGATENDVAAAVSDAMFRAGGEAPAVMPYITSGPRSMIGHATWEGRELQKNEHVFLEVGGCVRRYHTAMMRTCLMGEASDSMTRAEQRMKLALAEVERVFRPGLTVSDADKLVRDIIADNDFGAELITRAGYSIGIAFPPSWDEGYILSLKQGDPAILREGMTIHLIPWVWGVDGDKTCGTSETFLITRDSCESFFGLDRSFVRRSNDGKTLSGGEPVSENERADPEALREDVAKDRTREGTPPATGRARKTRKEN